MNDELYKQIARNAMAYLHKYSFQALKTVTIVKGMSTEKCDTTSDWHKLVRDVLNRLAELGHIKKTEVSDKKHIWQVAPSSSLPANNSSYDWFLGKGMKFNSNPPSEKKPKHTPIAPLMIDWAEDSYDEPLQPKKETPVNSDLERRVKELEDSAIEDFNKIKKLTDQVEELKQIVESAPKKIEITIHKHKTIVLKNKVIPKEYNQILELAQCKRNILLVGPAGCGKSYVAKLVADSLDLPFSSISCTAGMSEAHFTGRTVPDFSKGKNNFQGTAFLDRYENGGVFLLDELDAADPNLLLVINTALANGYCNLPNRISKPIAEKHPDFLAIATANTFGKGGNRTYVGRSQLDESTLDRFRIGTVECSYDEKVERHLCPDNDLLTKCWEIRKRIVDSGLRRVMSSRFIQDAYIMKSQAKWNDEQILEVFVNGWTPEEVIKVRPVTN